MTYTPIGQDLSLAIIFSSLDEIHRISKKQCHIQEARYGSALWNQTQDEIKMTQTLERFRDKLKKHLAAQQVGSK